MPELKITDNAQRDLLLSTLISHVRKCRDIIKLHDESKYALKENAITSKTQKANNEMHAANAAMVPITSLRRKSKTHLLG